MNKVDEIKKIIADFGGEVILQTPIVIKKSPHTPPIKIRGKIDNNYEFESLNEDTLNSIMQRLRLLYYYKNDKIWNI